jgi:NAD(P)-dependent dehydrogenase (short-subunit alcohol dehydrogenase family)
VIWGPRLPYSSVRSPNSLVIVPLVRRLASPAPRLGLSECRAAKAGLEGLTRGYALRLASEGVTVNAVAPGLIDTEMGRPLIEAGIAARIPVGRVGTGEEIAQAIMPLVRDAFITGQTLAANGGALFS